MILEDTSNVFWRIGTDVQGRLTATVVASGPGDLVFVNVGGISRQIKISTIGTFFSTVVTFDPDYSSSERINSTAVITTDSVGRVRAVSSSTLEGLSVFAADPDWTEPIRERTEYLTDVLPSYDGHEQRISLRRTPRTLLTYRILAMDRRESATVEAQINGAQGEIMGVPFWPDLQPLLVSAAGGDATIEVDTTFRRFIAGGFVMLWRDLYTFEVAEIATVSGGSIDLAHVLVEDWSANGTYVIPLLKGRMPDSLPLTFLTNSLTELEVTFECGDPELDESAPGEGAGETAAPELHECPV